MLCPEQSPNNAADGLKPLVLCSSFFQVEPQHKSVLALVWDNAAWHVSQQVKRWIKAHNTNVKQTGKGVRLIICRLPVKSPWLNAIEPKWVHGKRAIVEPARKLTA